MYSSLLLNSIPLYEDTTVKTVPSPLKRSLSHSQFLAIMNKLIEVLYRYVSFLLGRLLGHWAGVCLGNAVSVFIVAILVGMQFQFPKLST